MPGGFDRGVPGMIGQPAPLPSPPLEAPACPLPSSSPSGRRCPSGCGSRSTAPSTTCAARTTAGGAPRSRRRPEADYGFLLDDNEHAPPGPAVAAAARGRARPLPAVRPRRPRVGRRRLDRPPAGRRRRLRAAHRHVHARGHPRRRDRPAGPPRPPRRRLRRAAAGQRLQRHAQLGLRRRPLVRRAGGVRRPGGLPAVRRRLPPAGPRRDPGRRLQPPRPVGELPARVLPDLRRGRREHLGQLDQPVAAPTPTRCAATSSTTR